MKEYNNMKEYLFIMVVAVLLSSCSSLKVTNAYKQKNISGLQGVPNKMEYIVVINSKNPFTINGFELKRNKQVIKIDKYSFINKKTNLGHTVLKSKKEFQKGVYKISFYLEDLKESLLEETLNISFTINNKNETQNILLSDKKGVISK